ncbi:MAG: aspartate--tRNA ligase, partial [Terriglobales bacterium]
MLDFLGNLQRTHTNGQLRASDAGAKVVLMGWVNRRRDLGNLIFIDLRDRTGITQVVFNTETSNDIHEKASGLRSEYVIAVVGTVKKREPNTINKNVATGEIEIVATELRVLNDAKTPPFSIADDEVANEEVRLKYRYLDLRRGPLQANIELRHKVALAIRTELARLGFMEIETPFMTRSTPEGARDYLVPSRVHEGSFYALPQSPQLFKQILMISGFDKYFQIVRCFRDEDLRADRQPEFTQIDLEMTYPQQETVFAVVESFLTAAFKAAGHDLKTPFPRMTYDQAIAQYGSDKPDMRLPAMTDVAKLFKNSEWTPLKVDLSLPVLAIRIPNIGPVSNKEVTQDRRALLSVSTQAVKLIDDKFLSKFIPGGFESIRKSIDAAESDLVYLVAASTGLSESPNAPDIPVLGGYAPAEPLKPTKEKIQKWAGDLRLALARNYAARHKLFEKSGDVGKDFRWLWVTDFPMFEWDDDGKRWAAAHHPFT